MNVNTDAFKALTAEVEQMAAEVKLLRETIGAQETLTGLIYQKGRDDLWAEWFSGRRPRKRAARTGDRPDLRVIAGGGS